MHNRHCIVALIAVFIANPAPAAPALGDTRLKQMPSIQQTSPTLQSGKTLMLNLKPELTTFSPTDCVNKGGRLVVNGKNLGSRSGRGIALGGNGVHVDLNVSSWTSTSIVTTVPNDNRLIAGKTYYAGVEKSDHSEWLSNFANGIKICSGGGSGGMIIDRNLADKVIDSPGIQPAGGVLTLPSSSSSSSSSRSHPPIEEARSGGGGSSSSRDHEPIEEVRSDERDSGGGGSTQQDDADDQSDEYWYDYDEPAPAAPVTPSQQVTPDRSGSLMGRGVPPAPQLPKAAQRDKDETQYEPGQVVVITASMEESMELGRQLMQQGVRIKTRTPLNNLGLVLNVLRLPQGMDVQQALGVLRESYTGLWVDTNQRFRLMSSDRKRSAQNLIGWRAQALNCADSLRIGMVDTAVNTDHEALSGQAVTTKNFLRRSTSQAGDDHGTAVAALLVGNRTGEYAGLLPEAHLFAAEVFRERDDKTETTAEWLIRGLDWLLGQRVDVVNLSLGGPRNLVVELAIQRTLERGAGVVAAAGNGGTSTSPVYPAAQDGVIAVTAVDARRSIYGDASRGDYVDIAAPGVDVWVAEGDGRGAYRSGTSYAAPFVSAVAATWRSKHRGESMLDPIQNAAMDLGRPGKDPVYGWGLVQWKVGCN